MSVECSTTNISDLPEIQLNNSCQRGTQKMRDGQMVLETNELNNSAPLPPQLTPCLLYTSPSPRDGLLSRLPSSA